MSVLPIITPHLAISYGLMVTFQFNGWWLFRGPCPPSILARKRSLSDPVSLTEVLLSKGSCKGQRNSKIDSWTRKRRGSLSWLSAVPFYSARSFPWWYYQSTVRRWAWRGWAFGDLSADRERTSFPWGNFRASLTTLICVLAKHPTLSLSPLLPPLLHLWFSS